MPRIKLLRALMGLEVREDPNGAGQHTGRLILPRGFDATRITELIIPAADDGWSGHRDAGILPTGHALTASVER
ncbi:hypothetical protein [Nonomuraea diastatica]|uniref:Uncharacterized protein n=1 Tax=Nonomuraea diastatica TaxID=1848329 RepID=A0A4R4WEE0_9ACTN|nr:hypothetical protein [Nonomuraea diastatica]TDD16621.1 hypothetical protein E1294_30795 [Nonomuraea diastatica]